MDIPIDSLSVCGLFLVIADPWTAELDLRSGEKGSEV